MVIIDQLRISDDGTQMYINAHVNTAKYFDNIYISSLTIMTADHVSETDPGTPDKDYIYNTAFDSETKEISLVLSAADFTKTWETDADSISFKKAEMSTTLFFVYITCKGTVTDCTPCTLDELTTIGVTFDEKVLYQKVMSYTRMLADDCNVPVGFADFILLWNAFKAAVETDHYIPAIKYWNMLFDNYSAPTGIKNCGCNG